MNKPLATALVLAVLAAGCAAAALPDRPMPRPYALPEEDIQLGSGLRVLVQEDHSSPVIAVVSAYSVGSTSDPKGREGLAHLVEHLAFRTHFYDGGPIWEHLKHMGANFNAFTNWDNTVYFTVAHKDYLAKLLQMEAWRIFKNTDGVTPETFATEREVVRQELRLGSETNTGSKMFDAVVTALYPPGHPLSRGIGGTHESTSAMTLEDARTFVRNYYRPDNCTIVVAGDVDPKEVRKLIGTWPPQLLFGPQGPNGPKAPPRSLVVNRPLPPVPPPVNQALVREKGPVTQPQLWLAWSAPGGHRHNDALMRFVAQRVNGALFRGIEFKEEDDDIEGVGASVESLVDGSMLVVMASLRPGANPDKARTRILDSLVNAWTTELGLFQLQAGRWGTRTQLLHQSSNLTATALATAEHLASTGDPAYFRDSSDDLDKITASDVTDLAYKYLRRERVVSIYIEPESEEVAKLVGGGKGGGGAAKPDLVRSQLKGTEDLDPTRILQIARSPGLASLPRWTLPNGLEVVAYKHGAAPVAQISVGIRGGDAFTRPYGLASYASVFSRANCRDHGDLFSVGGGMGGGAGDTSSNFFAQVISGNLSNGIAVLSDELSCQEVNEEAFQRHDQFLKQSTKFYDRAAKRPNFIAAKRLLGDLYPAHPYGMLLPDPATLKNVNYDDAAAFVRSHFRPSNALAVVVGDIDPAETKALTEKYFARWTGGGAGGVSLPAPPPPPAARKVYLVNRPGATQGEVSVGCRLADATPETLPAYDVAEAVAGDMAWSVREEWGASYGVNAGVATLPGGAAHMVVGGAIDTRWVGRSVNRLLGILADIASPNLDEKLFLVKRWDVARQFTQRFSSGGGIAGAILQANAAGWPVDVWDKYPERLAATNRDTVRALFKPCVGHEIVSIAGDADLVRPQLEAFGLKLEAN
jgi:zinc protease